MNNKNTKIELNQIEVSLPINIIQCIKDGKRRSRVLLGIKMTLMSYKVRLKVCFQKINSN